MAIIVGENGKGIPRELIRLELLKYNIESRFLRKPMHLQLIFKAAPSYTNGGSEGLFRDGLCLPSGSNLKVEDKSRIKTPLLTILST